MFSASKRGPPCLDGRSPTLWLRISRPCTPLPPVNSGARAAQSDAIRLARSTSMSPLLENKPHIKKIDGYQLSCCRHPPRIVPPPNALGITYVGSSANLESALRKYIFEHILATRIV